MRWVVRAGLDRAAAGSGARFLYNAPMAARSGTALHWIPGIEELLDAIDDAIRLPAAMARLAQRLTPSARSYVVVFRRKHVPRLLFHEPELSEREAPSAETWKPLFVLNPFHAAYVEGRFGCLPLRKIMPAGFDKTEYFRRHYDAEGIEDELIHMALPQGGGSQTIVTGLVREHGEGRYREAEIAVQSQLYPIIETCSRRLAKLLPDVSEPGEGTLADNVENALDLFGTGLLTQRERQVIGLLLRGHNSESIAAQLEIARDTVKLHRRHAYAKLRVNSQGELFYKFLETLEPNARLD